MLGRTGFTKCQTSDIPPASDSRVWLPESRRHNCQLFVCTCAPAAVNDLSFQISQCVTAVAAWMKSNRLQLNPDKTGPVVLHKPSSASATNDSNADRRGTNRSSLQCA